MGLIKEKIGRLVATYLDKELDNYHPFSVHDTSILRKTLEPCDILLVEGNARISSTIKYLTQSTWSHAAFHAGNMEGEIKDGEKCCLIEAELTEGVVATPLSKYQEFNTRICRPVGLSEVDKHKVVNYMVGSLGKQYDLKNITDLLRYLVPLPIPSRFRRQMIALGSGDPTRAICSSLIAQAFQSVKYPILPAIERSKHLQKNYHQSEQELLSIRHHSLFSPRDFDVSPYFEIVKPTIENNFNYKTLRWTHDEYEERYVSEEQLRKEVKAK